MVNAASLNWIGRSMGAQRIRGLIRKASSTSFPVLIWGECGTGKRLVARLIHRGLSRERPLVMVDCGALDHSRPGSELFCFANGKACDRTCLLALASNGTLLFNEFTDLPMWLQVRIEPLVCEGFFRPIGSQERVPFNGRIIATSSTNLEAELRNGTLSKRLYYSLNAVSVRLPPLRERKEDIPLIAERFLQSLRFPQNGTERSTWGKELSPGALAVLLAYDWPGNVVELENCLASAVTLCSGQIIQPENLPTRMRFYTVEAPGTVESNGGKKEIERQVILHTLTSVGGDRRLAAKHLGISRSTIYRKLRQYDMLSGSGVIEWRWPRRQQTHHHRKTDGADSGRPAQVKTLTASDRN